MPLSALMQQYMTLKAEHPECLLFFRLGDFYEMFFEDAVIAAKILDLTLTGRDCGLENRAPMCGVPHHAVEGYIAKLLQSGKKVALCEQLSEPKPGRALVDRGVVRVFTPGTVTDDSMLSPVLSNYILSLSIDGTGLAMAYSDISTGEMLVERIAINELEESLSRIHPSEILVNPSNLLELTPVRLSVVPTIFESACWTASKGRDLAKKHFQDVSDEVSLPAEAAAVGALLDYLKNTQKNDLSQLLSLRVRDAKNVLKLDEAAIVNLELFQTLRRGNKRGTLLSLMDETVTAMGARQLRQWMENPLGQVDAIQERLMAVEALVDAPMATQSLRDALHSICDLERISARLSYGTILPRQVLALSSAFAALPTVAGAIQALGVPLLRTLEIGLDDFSDLQQTIDSLIDIDAPAALQDGGVILKGANNELDQLRLAASEGRQWIADLEMREREATGIKTLRIVYNKIFGYCLEVTKSFWSQVPLSYTRRQTLSGVERYTTPELYEIEKKILGASGAAQRLEQALYQALVEHLQGAIGRMQKAAASIKALDALQSLATIAVRYGYCKPEINDASVLDIENGRHPVVEQLMRQGERFVPNSVKMDAETVRMWIVTGPNMAGKSTYMRQTALIVLMAHMGSFVPASRAKIPLTDRILTRIGASDDVSGGQSTFLVEMNEMAAILRKATNRSLILLDEIGRGTSTYDGLSIAWAIVESLSSPEMGAKTLFATHYHELTELEGQLDGVANCRIAVKEHGDELIFLRRVERGGADKSFGIQVARMAGIRKPIIKRAFEILHTLESSDVMKPEISERIAQTSEDSRQTGLLDAPGLSVLENLKTLNPNAMTPMDALACLNRLCLEARGLS